MSTKAMRINAFFLLLVFFLFIPVVAFADLNDLFGKKELDEEDRQQTIERIESIQEKLKLLQDKLRALERRKAAKESAQKAEELGAKLAEAPASVNWLPVDDTVTSPGGYGLYTYLLFSGSQEDTAAIGSLEDFILTIETLPANETPASLANCFLVPVEKPQSVINLGRQPFDFKLNRAYLDRLGITGDLPSGPVLVSSSQPVDPYASGETEASLAVAIGKQAPGQTARLANIWHQYEIDSVGDNRHSVTDLFWQLIDGLGTVQVKRDKQKIVAILGQ